MKRRSFLKTAACTAVCTSETGCEIDRNQPEKTNVTKPDIVTLAGYTLEELRELYRNDLFDDFLPFMEKYVIDHEEGGFKCNTDRDGTNLSNEKRTTYEGRGTWVYSFLYNKIDNDPKYLEVARKSIEYMQKKNLMKLKIVFSWHGDIRSIPKLKVMRNTGTRQKTSCSAPACTARE